MTADPGATTGATTTALTCPKCMSPMRAYERNGITVDQCTGCRGIFLDRGELERLIEAEDVHYGSGAPDPQQDPSALPPYGSGYDPGGHGSKHGGGRTHGGEYGGGQPQRKKRGGFLGDLLDFG